MKQIVEDRSDELTANLDSILVSPDNKEEVPICISSYGEGKKSIFPGSIDNKPEVLAYKVDNKADKINLAPQPGVDAVRTKTQQALSKIAADNEKGIDPEANGLVRIQINSMEANTRPIPHILKEKEGGAILAQLSAYLANTFKGLRRAMGIFNQGPFREKYADIAQPRSFIKSNDPANGNHMLPRTDSHIYNYFFPVLLALTL